VPHEPEVDFIKRVVGLGGDRIQVRDGRLYLNNTLVERNPIDDSMIAALPEDFENGHIYRETLPDGASYLIVERGDDTWLDDTPEFVVPADTVFVLGDNRDSSIDSRTKLGFVPITGLRDKPLFVFWSVDLSRIGRVFE
jgi:signal peptidase I